MTESPNRVFLHPKGYIEIQTVGVQSPDSVKAMGDEVMILAKPMLAEGRVVLILDNLTDLSLKQPSSVPKAVAAEARRIPFTRAAMLGGPNRMLKYGSNFIIRATGKSDSLRYFTDRQTAEDWLLGK